jgi:N-acetylglucosaminyldiphosphoundecaprenol N-acetyl-beta-D-mannosaminyltransferase
MPSNNNRHSFEKARILDVLIDLLNPENLLVVVTDTIESGKRIMIANHNLHSLSLYHGSQNRNAAFNRFYASAKFTLADGMSIVALGRIYGQNIRREHRIAYNDWLPDLLPVASSNDWRIFYLGSSPDSSARGIRILREQYPKLDLRFHHGHFDPNGDENKQVLEEINACKPHILFVGMGMPRQECWIVENQQHLSANVILSSGGTLDCVSGQTPLAPRWLGQIGLEWLFRLATEPRRLAYRYLIEPWTLLRAMISHS